jgi:flagellar motor switch protein FliG
MLKTVTHRRRFLTLAGLLLGLSSLVWARWEKEQVALENQLTQRIESILSKTLPPNSYLVTIKVEMSDSGGGTSRTVNKRGGGNPFMKQNKFVLPGVPEKKQFSTEPEVTEENTVVNQPVEALVKRILITILVSPDISADQIRSLRTFITSSIPFNPVRGDEIDIQPSPLLKAPEPETKSMSPMAAAGAANAQSPWEKFSSQMNLPFLVLLSVVAFGIVGLAVFLFGPVRAFFNRLLAVLPRVGEQAMFAANANGAGGGTATANPAASALANTLRSDSSQNDGPKLNMPFQFIREEQLPKLALLFRELSSTEAALVIGYLPPAWASHLLTNLDPSTQAAITRELSTSREVSSEVVAQVEAQIKEKLPYMVGGREWIQSVFPMTPPQTQRVLLSQLAQDAPELARALRAKTFFFEDLVGLGAGALRVLVQDMGYPQMALALKDEKKETQDAVVRRLPPAIGQIIQQELELSGADKNGIAEAKNRLVMVARQLLTDGRIALGGAQ